METTVQEIEPKTSGRELGRTARESLKDLFKAQNVLLDLANKQNAIAFKVVRERLKGGDSSPAIALVDSVEEIVEGVVSMQKSIVDIGTERVSREPEAEAEETEESEPKKKRALPRVPFAELFRKNFEASVEAQREILGLLEKQGKLGVKAVEEMSLFSARKSLQNITATAKESVENVLDTQGRLIDLAARRRKDSIGLIADQEKPLISKEMARHAEEGIDNLRKAQSKLVKIAGDVNARVYERVEARTEEPEEPKASKIAERVNSGIERVVKAQNDLLDASLRAVKREKTDRA